MLKLQDFRILEKDEKAQGYKRTMETDDGVIFASFHVDESAYTASGERRYHIHIGAHGSPVSSTAEEAVQEALNKVNAMLKALTHS